jgi:hypothetical protein
VLALEEVLEQLQLIQRVTVFLEVTVVQGLLPLLQGHLFFMLAVVAAVDGVLLELLLVTVLELTVVDLAVEQMVQELRANQELQTLAVAVAAVVLGTQVLVLEVVMVALGLLFFLYQRRTIRG